MCGVVKVMIWPGVARVGDHLLIAAEHRVEHDLAGGDRRLGADQLPLEHAAVGEHERTLADHDAPPDSVRVSDTTPRTRRAHTNFGKRDPSACQSSLVHEHSSVNRRSVADDGSAVEDRVADPPAQRDADVRRVAALAGQPRRNDLPHLVRIEDREVGGLTWCDRATVAVGHSGDRCRLPRQRGDDVGERPCRATPTTPRALSRARACPAVPGRAAAPWSRERAERGRWRSHRSCRRPARRGSRRGPRRCAAVG